MNPIAPNDTPYGRQRNRRVQIYLAAEEKAEDAVEVVTRDARGLRATAFPRHWARVRLVRSRGWHPSRLLIESHGRTCEVGGLLTEEERRGLHARLKRLVGAVDESPRLEAAGTA